MNKTFFLIITLAVCSFAACKSDAQATGQSTPEATKVSNYTDLNVEQFKAKMSDPNIVILDVRTPEEVAAGKIEGALEMNFYDNDFKEKVVALDKEKTYLVYCKSGGRSGKACKMLQGAGFPSLYNLDGGWTAWSK